MDEVISLSFRWISFKLLLAAALCRKYKVHDQMQQHTCSHHSLKPVFSCFCDKFKKTGCKQIEKDAPLFPIFFFFFTYAINSISYSQRIHTKKYIYEFHLHFPPTGHAKHDLISGMHLCSLSSGFDCSLEIGVLDYQPTPPHPTPLWLSPRSQRSPGCSWCCWSSPGGPWSPGWPLPSAGAGGWQPSGASTAAASLSVWSPPAGERERKREGERV